MHPTTTGRFRVHDRRERPAAAGPDDGDRRDGADEEFVLVEHHDEPVAPADPDAAEAYDPLYVDATAYGDALGDAVAKLDPGNVVETTLAWDDGDARFESVEVVRETRFRFADNVEGIFEAAVEGWQDARAAGEAMTATTTRSQDGDPNGALYLFADAPGRDTFAEMKAGTIPIEPLVARVNQRRDDDAEREVFVLRPADYEFVAVYVVFERDGVLAGTVRDTYNLGLGLAEGLDSAPDDQQNGGDSNDDTNDEFDLQDRL
ncbi:hypothetical protein JCM17823_19980 [Halorubrum gandharaense]